MKTLSTSKNFENNAFFLLLQIPESQNALVIIFSAVKLYQNFVQRLLLVFLVRIFSGAEVRVRFGFDCSAFWVKEFFVTSFLTEVAAFAVAKFLLNI